MYVRTLRFYCTRSFAFPYMENNKPRNGKRKLRNTHKEKYIAWPCLALCLFLSLGLLILYVCRKPHNQAMWTYGLGIICTVAT